MPAAAVELMESEGEPDLPALVGRGLSVMSDATHSSSRILSGLKGCSPGDSKPVTALSIVMVLT